MVAGLVLAAQVLAAQVLAGQVLAGLVLAGLVLAGLVVAGLVVAGLVVAGLVVAGHGPRAMDRGPRPAVHGPWRVSKHPPTPGPKKRAGGGAARALARFYTVSFT